MGTECGKSHERGCLLCFISALGYSGKADCELNGSHERQSRLILEFRCIRRQERWQSSQVQRETPKVVTWGARRGRDPQSQKAGAGVTGALSLGLLETRASTARPRPSVSARPSGLPVLPQLPARPWEPQILRCGPRPAAGESVRASCCTCGIGCNLSRRIFFFS